MTTYTAAYSSPWVPAPVLEACGFTAVPVYDTTGLPNTLSGAATKEGRCPWSHIFEQYANSGNFDVVILATTCDQMRRASETLDSSAQVFALTVPSTNSAASLRFYQSEILRLASFLTRMSGVAPAPESLSEAVLRSMNLEHDSPHSSPVGPTAPICLIGNHLPVPFSELDKLITSKGGSIAINGLEYGERALPDLRQIEESQDVREAIAAVAECYFSGIKDVFRRPNSDFYRWLAVVIKKEAVKGILLVRNSWCDHWAIEAVRLRNWTELPVLELEFSSNSISMSAISRVEAFIETCKQ